MVVVAPTTVVPGPDLPVVEVPPEPVVVVPPVPVVVVPDDGCVNGRIKRLVALRLHRPEPQLRGLADEALGLGAVLHAGQVDDDRVALALHVGFRDAEAVDAVADDVGSRC